eukprot:m.49170 g.49170  ORF g.49170 m.49170 type:complete len:128 (-) comp11079_c1_seq1:1736-2119(-)
MAWWQQSIRAFVRGRSAITQSPWVASQLARQQLRANWQARSIHTTSGTAQARDKVFVYPGSETRDNSNVCVCVFSNNDSSQLMAIKKPREVLLYICELHLELHTSRPDLARLIEQLFPVDPFFSHLQ